VASFGGFAPTDDPGIVCLVVIDEPEGRGLGGEVAAPVFSRIVQRVARGPCHTHLVARGPAGLGRDNVAARAGGGTSSIALASTRRSAVADAYRDDDAVDAQCSGRAGRAEDDARDPENGRHEASLELVVLPGSAEEDVVVPDVRGMSIRLARRTVSRLGLALAFEGSGVVRNQTPRCGSVVRSGTKVNVRCYPG
jgi:hypothetical protein